MQIRILTAADVKAALPMPKAIEAMKLAFGQFSAGEATVPLRGRLHTDKGVTLLMPAFLKRSRDLAVKVVSVFGDNPTLGLPTVSALVLVLDAETGIPRAMMEGDSLTALRTGAAGGLAADLLARKGASKVALFGAGVQGRAQLAAACAVRPIREVMVFDPVPAAAARVVEEIGTWPDGPRARTAASAAEAVRRADIVLTATTSATPVFNGSDLPSGAHVTAVGSFTPDMQEIDASVVERAYVVVDAREAAMTESGDLIKARAVVDAELGEIVNNDKPGRRDDTQITLFKSVGMAAQDAAAAAAVLSAAEHKGLGTAIDLT
jgi:ornithine cyclodeaminase/alanine dehydrogenase-like protein (mu-crystallin family)